MKNGNKKAETVDWTATFEKLKSLRGALKDAGSIGQIRAARLRYEHFLEKEIDAKGAEVIFENFSGEPLAITTMPVVLAGRLP